MAEREGFEPSVRLLTVHSLSRRAPSADSAISPFFELSAVSVQLSAKIKTILGFVTGRPPQLPAASYLLELAEGEGFEPPVPLITGQRFSRPPPSTSRPSLLSMISSTYRFGCQDYSPKPTHILHSPFGDRCHPPHYNGGTSAPTSSHRSS